MTRKSTKTALLVLGMHRSGTSAFTRVLSMLGYALPFSVSGASKGNEKGHWESAAVAGFNDSVLAELNLKWYSWTAIRIESLGSLRKAQIIDDLANTVRADFSLDQDFILKDPRACRLTSVLMPALKKLNVKVKVIIPIRNPLEVAESLFRRDGISKGQAVLIWLRYILDAELGSRNFDRTFVRYDNLIDVAMPTIGKIIDDLNLSPNIELKAAADDINRFLAPILRHQNIPFDQVYLDPLTKGWVGRTMDALTRLSNQIDIHEAQANLDLIRSEFNHATPFMETIFNSMHVENQASISDVKALLAEKDALVSEEKEAAAISQEKLDQHKKEFELLRKEISETHAGFATSKEVWLSEKSDLLGKLNSKSQDVIEKEGLIQNLNASVSELQEHVEGLSGQLSEAAATSEEMDRLATHLDELNHKVKITNTAKDALAAEVATRDTKIVQLEGEVSQLASTLKQRSAELIDRSEVEDSLKKELKALGFQTKEYEGQLQSSSKKLLESESYVAKLVSDLTTERDKITSLTLENSSVKSALAALKNDLEGLEGEKRTLEAERKELDLSLDLSKSDFEILSNKVARLTNEKADLSQKLTSISEESSIFTRHASEEKQALGNEVRHLRDRLAQEQRTVFKPAVRRVRSFIGKTLRMVLPNSLVEKMAFTVPTAEQKQILKMRQAEQSNALSNMSLANLETSGTEVRAGKSDVFVFAIIGWHFRMQRPQHIAKELCKLGHRVFYFEMDPPGAETEIEEILPNLIRVKLKLSGAEQIPSYTGTPDAAQQKAWLKSFYNFCDEVNASNHKELIIQHPFWWQLAKLLPPEFRTLNDCMDDIAGFDNTTQELIDLEYSFLQNVDDLVVSSTTLFNKYSRFNPLDIIRNGTELHHFQNPDMSALTEPFTAKPLTSSEGAAIKVGYVGAISDWFDTELLREVARVRPDIEFHLCGNVSVEHPKSLAKEPNVKFYGEIPYVQVPAFLQQMDVLIIPFRIIPIIQACDPVKFYEYSTLGKPTVTTPLPELDRAKHLAFFADGAQEFSKQIDAAFEAKDDEDFVQELKEFAAQNTWTHRAQQFSQIIDSYPKVSVVILAYGDPDLTNTTLHSLMGTGPVYPNMEIIIVDNGSSGEALKNIHSFSEQYQNTRIIANGENLGFAGGNNVGLEDATGDYVLLLNNDTYVSPGAIYGMMRHLQKSPKVGAVGPLTNNIGNEAKLFVEYDTMDDMIVKTRALKTGYRGKHIATRVVAYFAVMFRNNDLKKFGMLSADYGRGMFEDDDHCHKIRQDGYECVVAEDAFVHHHLSATFSKMNEDERVKLFNENKATFERKWGPWQPHEYRHDRQPSDILFPNEDLF